mmetsp:Transcript_17209/g.40379  ORF Transcript_17209/g.40379 Transcript_17209/m.40379 type:complete len:302 (+) Transcript_17209:43-948(+)
MNPTIILGVSAVLLGAGAVAWILLADTYKSGNYSTVSELCEAHNAEEGSEIDYLCKIMQEEDDEVKLDEVIGCGDGSSDDMSFTMEEILGADDVQAAFDAVMDRCSGGGDGGRKLLTADYGWCSTNLWDNKVNGEGDSANYCNPLQSCSGRSGCGNTDREVQLRHCCEGHDACLTLGKDNGGNLKMYWEDIFNGNNHLDKTTDNWQSNWDDLKVQGSHSMVNSVGRCSDTLGYNGDVNLAAGSRSCTKGCDQAWGACAWEVSSIYECDRWYTGNRCMDEKALAAITLTAALRLKGWAGSSC